MKKLLFMAVCLLSFTMMTSCSGGDAPKTIAENVVKAATDGKYDDVKACGISEAEFTLLQTAIKAGTTYEVGEETITDKTATVAVKVTFEGETKETTLPFHEVDGEWKWGAATEEPAAEEAK